MKKKPGVRVGLLLFLCSIIQQMYSSPKFVVIPTGGGALCRRSAGTPAFCL